MASRRYRYNCHLLNHFLPLFRAGRKEIIFMKDKILTVISTLMLFIPWTILPLRRFDWALKSPTAEIMITSYALFMILSGIFTVIAYGWAKAQNSLMKICLVINCLYAVAGIAALAMIYLPGIL